jgi:hypothetical protein
MDTEQLEGSQKQFERIGGVGDVKLVYAAYEREAPRIDSDGEGERFCCPRDKCHARFFTLDALHDHERYDHGVYVPRV